MKIGCVTRHLYPTAQEIRVTKLAMTLKAHGHQFLVFCPGDMDSAESEAFEFGQVVRLRPWSSGRLGKLLFSPVPINPVWIIWLIRQFRQRALDLVIVRDLRLALPVMFAARICGIKAILDLGEHYPGMMEILGKQHLAHYITRNRWLITQLEVISVRFADLVWVVVDENRKRLQRYARNIEVINNYPVMADHGIAQTAEQRVYSNTGAPVILISLGLIDNIRGLDLAIDAFAILAQEFDNLQMHVYGDGFFREALEHQVQELGLQKKVLFRGWVREDEKSDVLASGDIGLVLHKVCDLTQHTVPNKLFDYMYVGLPVVVTRIRPVMRIVEHEQCGIAVDEEPADVAAGIRSLVLDVEKRRQFGRNGYHAIGTRYTWHTESDKIINTISDMVGR